MINALIAVWLISPAFAAGAASAAPPPAAPAAPAASAKPAKPGDVKISTAPAAAEVVDPGTIYTAEKLRDPFRQLSASAGGVATHPFSLDDFNIHNLSLRAIMKDRSISYALFSEQAYGVTFILRGSKLYDQKGKVVPGVTGALNIKQKTAHLTTQDNDVQVFRLGEEGAP